MDKAQQGKHERNVRKILRDPKEPVNDQNIKLLEDYLRKYFFARMTTRANLSALPQYRLDTRERCGWTASKDTADAGEEMNRIISSLMHSLCNGVLEATDRNGEKQNVIVVQRSVRDSDNKLRLVRSLADLKTDDRIFSLAGDAFEQSAITELVPSGMDFHPAVKLNAVLILGDLNDKQPKRNRPETAEPRLNSQMDLIAYLESPDQLSDVLLVGVLTGMQRHARESLDSETKKRIAKVLLSIVNAPDDSTRDPSARLWSRRQAIDILGQLDLPKTEKFLLKIIEDANESIGLRMAAVEAVQNLTLANLTPSAVSRFAIGMAQLAVSVCEEELAAALKPRSLFSPDRLRMRLVAIQNVLLGTGEEASDGLLAIVPEEEGKSLDQLLNTLKEVDAKIQTLTATSDREQVVSVLQKNIDDLRVLAAADAQKQPSAPQTAENR
ncbi:MAG: hypothetical protein VX970_08505 [Planctomycetota bacterium]|nr:hypothetical protein [Planctomycetota bacterium]